MKVDFINFDNMINHTHAIAVNKWINKCMFLFLINKTYTHVLWILNETLLMSTNKIGFHQEKVDFDKVSQVNYPACKELA